jgi:hypothetical protein
MTDQGTEYARFIEAGLKSENDRRDMVNSRLNTAITSATGLVTVTLVVLAVLKGKDFTLQGPALTALFVALFALLIAAALGVFGGLNWNYKVTDVPTMQLMLGTAHWGDTEVTARGITALCNVQTINSLRKGTDIKYKFLHTSGIAQLVALLSLGISAGIVVA